MEADGPPRKEHWEAVLERGSALDACVAACTCRATRDAAAGALVGLLGAVRSVALSKPAVPRILQLEPRRYTDSFYGCVVLSWDERDAVPVDKARGCVIVPGRDVGDERPLERLRWLLRRCPNVVSLRLGLYPGPPWEATSEFVEGELGELAPDLEVLDLSEVVLTRASLHAALAALPKLRVLLFSDGGGVDDVGRYGRVFQGMAEHPSLEYVKLSPYHDTMGDVRALVARCPALKALDLLLGSLFFGEFFALRKLVANNTDGLGRLTNIFASEYQLCCQGEEEVPINVLHDQEWERIEWVNENMSGSAWSG